MTTVQVRPAVTTLNEVRKIRLGSKWMTAEIDQDVTDIGRRLHQGDATVGWLGDPTLEVRIGVEVDRHDRPIPGGEQMFEVWGRDERGAPYVCLRWPRCDASMLRALAERDTRVHDMVALYEKHSRLREKEQADKLAEIQGAAADKAYWAIKQDLGQHLGGRRDQHFVNGLKKDADK